MRVLLLLAVATALLLPTDSALGQAGAIVLYADPAYTSCNVTAEPPVGQFLLVYAVHDYASAKASRWRLHNRGHLLTWFQDQPSGFVAGNGSQGGWAVSYGGCQQPPFLIATIWYQRLDPSTSPVCSSIEVVRDPMDYSTGWITASDCNDNLTYPDRSRLTFHDDGTCPCGGRRPVEETTWGQVKALYE